MTKDVLSIKCLRDGLNLNFTGVFESAFSDGALEFVLQEEIVPTGETGTLLPLVGEHLGFLFLGGTVVVSRNDFVHVPLYSFSKMNIREYLNY